MLVIVLIVGGVVALIVAVGAGAGFANRALVPIRRSLVAQREALRRQREFAADASHELRTPLTVIRASVDDLERHRTEPVATVGSALADIDYEVDHLTAMVEDLLLLARSDSGALELERVPVDLGDVASDGALVAGQGRHRARRLGERRPGSGRDLGRSGSAPPARDDPRRQRHPPRPDAARGSRSRSAPIGPDARLTVDDEGPGISQDDLPRVFDRFYRAPGAPGGGTGLGLAIAAWIVERHDGRIEAANRPTGGARFTARIPLARIATAP